MENANVIVFGAEGKLGKDLIELFAYEDCAHVKGYSHSMCDITKIDDLRNIMSGVDGSITHCINCVGYTNVDACEDNIELSNLINGKAVENLATICLEERIHLTHISTDYVFEGIKKQPLLEQEETNPLSQYGRSKLLGEGPVRAMGDKGLVIRTSWLYGKYGKKNFIDTVLDKIQLGAKVKVITDQVGSPTYSMDLANTIIQLALNFKSGLFNVVNEGQCSWYEFALKAVEYMKEKTEYIIPVTSEQLNRKAIRPQFSALSTLRLRQTLPEPIRKWEDALYQYLIETRRLYEF
jgi:dTDP-4-dehydrorhamnose reductase